MPIEREGNELVCSDQSDAALVQKIVEEEPFLSGSAKNILIHPAGAKDKVRQTNVKKIQEIFDRVSIPSRFDNVLHCLCVTGIALEELVARMSSAGLISEDFRNEILSEVTSYRRVAG